MNPLIQKIAAFAFIFAGLFLLFLGSCRKQTSLPDYVENLPDLPQKIADSLDPKTFATRIPANYPVPVKESQAILAPCCGSKDTKSLKVNFSHTKCGPLRDFIVAPVVGALFSDAGRGGGSPSPRPGSFTAYKLRALNGRTLPNTMICMTMDGPWEATLIEDRYCNGYSPQDTLIINAFGDIVQLAWNGGIQNHPPEVQVVSCREVFLHRYNCGQLSACTCDSSSCPPEQPCDCNLEGQW